MRVQLVDKLPNKTKPAYRRLTKEQCLALLKHVGGRILYESVCEIVITAASDGLRLYGVGDYWLQGPYQFTEDQYQFLQSQGIDNLSLRSFYPPEHWAEERDESEDEWWALGRLYLAGFQPGKEYFSFHMLDDLSDLDFFETWEDAEYALYRASRQGCPNEELSWDELNLRQLRAVSSSLNLLGVPDSDAG